MDSTPLPRTVDPRVILSLEPPSIAALWAKRQQHSCRRRNCGPWSRCWYLATRKPATARAEVAHGGESPGLPAVRVKPFSAIVDAPEYPVASATRGEPGQAGKFAFDAEYHRHSRTVCRCRQTARVRRRLYVLQKRPSGVRADFNQERGASLPCVTGSLHICWDHPKPRETMVARPRRHVSRAVSVSRDCYPAFQRTRPSRYSYQPQGP